MGPQQQRRYRQELSAECPLCLEGVRFGGPLLRRPLVLRRWTIVVGIQDRENGGIDAHAIDLMALAKVSATAGGRTT